MLCCLCMYTKVFEVAEEYVMKIVVAIDSLKGSLSSLEAGEAMKDGILKAMADAEVWVSPLADGGEGTVEASSEKYLAK